MILLFSFILLLLAHVLPFLFGGRSPLTSPYKLIALLGFATVIPHALILSIFEGRPTGSIFGSRLEFQYFMTQFNILYALGTLAVYLGIYLFPHPRRLNIKITLSDGMMLALLFVAFSLFGLASFERINSAGGLAQIFANIDRRSQIFNDAGPLAILVQPMAFLVSFLLFYLRSKGRIPMFLVVGIVAFVFLLLSVYGGRKAPMFFLLFCLLSYNFYVRRVRIFSASTIAFLSFSIVFFIWMRDFRGSTDLSDADLWSVVEESIVNASYVDTYLFIMKYFSENGFWHGATFGDIIGRFGLVDLQGARPPIDDGVYIRTLAEGWHVRPPTDFHSMFPSSWPPESFGSGYLNFGIFGVILFFFIRGLVIGFFFAFVKSGRASPIILFLFYFSILNFHLTNLRIVQMFLILLPVAGIYVSFVLAQSVLRRA